MKLIAALQRRRNIADKTLQSATTSKHTNQQIARIDLREPASRQLEHVVRRAVSQRANDNDVAGLRRLRRGDERTVFASASGDVAEPILSTSMTLISCSSSTSQSESQRVQLDETFSIALVVNRVSLKRGDLLVVERIWRTPPDDDRVSAKEL